MWHLLDRAVQVWRPVRISDGAGGTHTNLTQVGSAQANISQPPTTERVVADQAGARHDTAILFGPGVDVRRGDQLRDDTRAWRVIAVVEPSTRAYLRVEALTVEAEDI